MVGRQLIAPRRLDQETNSISGHTEDAVQGDGIGRWWSRKDGFDSPSKLCDTEPMVYEADKQFTMSSFVEVRKVGHGRAQLTSIALRPNDRRLLSETVGSRWAAMSARGSGYRWAR
jgi:hypothetical protein